MTRQEQYYLSKKAVIEKFDKDFFDKYYINDAAFHAVVEALARDKNPYEIIQLLIEERRQLLDKLIKQ